MTKPRISLLAAALLLVGACAPRRSPAERPAWLDEMIAQLQAEQVANPPASVVRYERDGNVFYYVPAKCCDVPSKLYDSQGRIVCNPDGGVLGKGDGRCPSALRNLTGGAVIWRDSRKGP